MQLQNPHPPVSDRRWAAGVVLSLLLLVLHLPFLPRSLEDLDSINFALGVRHFDVANHQPHPPGYPIYMAIAKLVHVVVADETRVLVLISVCAGALAVWSLLALFTRIDRTWPRNWILAAVVGTVTCPLYWITASRPLSDMAGFAAAVGIQAWLLSASTRRDIVAASFLAALAVGIRSQVAWLTVPLLAYVIVTGWRRHGRSLAVGAAAAFAAGCLIWAVPLVIVSGGPVAYWRALFAQGSEDLTGIEMLWTRPTPRELVRALYFAFPASWAEWWLALPVLLLSLGGAIGLYRRAKRSLWILVVLFGPYLVFDLLFQETFTTRYALPLVAPVAYLALRGLSAVPQPASALLALAALGMSMAIDVPALSGYSALEAPAFRLLHDMTAAGRGAPDTMPVLAMHRREALDLRRPIQWAGADLPAFSQRLPSPPKHEWLELVKYWNGGGRAPVWFVADPQRTDLALVDRTAVRGSEYRWPMREPILIGGVRPNEMDWRVFDSPGWYLGEGWALTPETAGLADQDHRGPGLRPIEGWIRRRSEALTMMIGGRNFGTAPATISAAIDGREIERWSAAPGFFLRFVPLGQGALLGDGRYAALTIEAASDGRTTARAAIEQFDAQSSGSVLLGFGDGWQEREYNPATGRSWRWMSERAVLVARSSRQPLKLTIEGDVESFWKSSHIRVRVGDRELDRWTASGPFAAEVPIPADAIVDDATSIVVESDQFFVPAERSRRSLDHRHLAVRVSEVRLTPAS
jgi:hypothetical protein